MKNIAGTIFSAALFGLILNWLVFVGPANVHAAVQAEQTRDYSGNINSGQLIQELGSNLSGKAVTYTFRVKTDATNLQQFAFTSHNTRIYDKDNGNSFIASCIPPESNAGDPLRGLTFNTVGVPAGYEDVSIDFSCRNYFFIPGHRYIIKIDNAGLHTNIHFAAASYGNSGNDYFTGGGLRYANENIFDYANNSGNCDPAKYFWNSLSPVGNGCWVWTSPRDDLYFKLTDSPYSPPTSKTPVIFIPGIGGSELKVATETYWSAPDGHGGEYRNTYEKDEVVWMNLLKAGLPGEDDYFDVLRMESDGYTSAAQIDVTDDVLPIAYATTLKFFNENGYVEGVDLFVFPYDWRQDIKLSEKKFEKKVLEVQQLTGASQVNIVAHSMGGLIGRSYISKPENSQRVKKLITLGTPYLGAVKFLKALREGECLTKSNIPTKPCVGVSPSEVKELLQNMIGGFELSPSAKYYEFYDGMSNKYPTPFRDERDIDLNGITGKLNYEQTKALLLNLGHNDLFGPSEDFHNLDNFLNLETDVEVTSIVGSGINTLGQIVEKNEVSFDGLETPLTEAILINGDGTVPLMSASLYDSDRDISRPKFSNVYFTNQSHEGLVNEGPAMELVINRLSNKNELPLKVFKEPIPLKGKLLGVFSPVNIHVFDVEGNHTGMNSLGDIETLIPGSTYETLGDAKYIFLPNDGNYQIKFEATDEGSFDFKIQSYVSNEMTDTFFYNDVPLKKETKGDMNLITNSIEAPVIKLDSEGNGMYESEVYITSHLTGDANYDSAAPTSKAEISGISGNDGWYKSDVVVKLDSNDNGGSGTQKIEFSLDDESTQIYTGPITISKELITKIKFRATDFAGNEEKSQTLELKIDKTNPVVEISSNTQLLWPPNGKFIEVKITGSSTDTNLKSTTFKVEDEYQTINPIISNFDEIVLLQASRNSADRDGRHYKIIVSAEDYAGNMNNSILVIIVPHDSSEM